MGKPMRKTGRERKGHAIDLLSSTVLFLVLTASSLSVVLFAANANKRIATKEEGNFAGRTCLSYVAEKIRQADENGSVSIGSLDGEPCLILRQDYGGQPCMRYLYSYEGQLCELFVKEGMAVSAADGQRILAVQGFQVTRQEEGIFRISCSDGDGGEAVTYAALKSRA